LQDLADLLDDFSLPFRRLAPEARSYLAQYRAVYRDHGMPPLMTIRYCQPSVQSCTRG
jgi:hypothetical protein